MEKAVRGKREDLPLKPIGFALAAVVAGLAPAAQAAPAPQAQTEDSNPVQKAPNQGDLFSR
jgi:hypothetical protein